MKIIVIGDGRWDGFIAWYLLGLGREVTIYDRPTSKQFPKLRQTRANGLAILSDVVLFCDDLKQAPEGVEVVTISIPSQSPRGLVQRLSQPSMTGKIVMLYMEGTEASTGKWLTEVAEKFLPSETDLAIWVGPGHVQDFTTGISNCMVIDNNTKETKQFLAEQFSDSLIRFYYEEGPFGNEARAISKNVIGIAADMLDGLNKTVLKGVLMPRGTRETARLVKAMGGDEISACGLTYLGDYQATISSPYSRNRAFGERFVKGEHYGELAESAAAIRAMFCLEGQHGVELPVCQAVEAAIRGGQTVDEVLPDLFLRSQEAEFWTNY